MYRNLKVTLTLLFAAGLPLQVHATPQTPRDASGEPLTAKEVRQLEKTATTAADHEQLAAYYQAQAQQAEKNLEDAQALEQKWGPMERASKVPDPYPHARRLVLDYSAQVQKYARLAADHQWIADKAEIAARALKTGGTASTSSTTESNPKVRNTFTLGPKK